MLQMSDFNRHLF